MANGNGRAPTSGEKFAKEIAAAIRARNAVIWVNTAEEERAERMIFEGCRIAGCEPITWDCGAGFLTLTGEPASPVAALVPQAAFAFIRDARKRAVYVMRDLGAFLVEPFSIRLLRNLARTLPLVPRDVARTVIVLGPRGEVPPELQASAIRIDLPLPDRQELADMADALIAANLTPEEIAGLSQATRDAAIDAAIGLTEESATALIKGSIVATSTLDPGRIAAEKRRVVSQVQGLEWIDVPEGGMANVGGMENFREWLGDRRDAFTPEARAYGLPAPKGVLMVGVPGCGKSLAAKASAAFLGVPLLRLDLGGTRSKYVGESEAGIRKALKIVETISPAVLWVDEIEKALAGATGPAGDGGVAADALGTLLSWLQERAGSVFVFATANDVSRLPPEMLRRGRWDEIFSIDLPTLEERASIVKAGLRQHRRKEEIDAVAVARASEGFIGAEIVALVGEALVSGFRDGRRPIRTADLIAAAGKVVPLSRTAPEQIARIREWAKERARPAGKAEASAANSRVAKVDR